MSQNTEGAVKIFCKRVGISTDLYYEKIKIGKKWCSGCKFWQDSSEFDKDKSRWDGLTASCSKYRNAYSRRKYQRKGRQSIKGKLLVPLRDGDKIQARSIVNKLIRNGIIPAPNDLPCNDCGHIYLMGDRRHEYHHESYAKEFHTKVIALCTCCHRKIHPDAGRKAKFKNKTNE